MSEEIKNTLNPAEVGTNFIDNFIIEDIAEVAVADRGDRVRCITDDIVIVSHDVEILKPGHLPIDCLKVRTVCLFPVFVVVITSIVRVCLLYVVDRSQYLVE